MNDLKVEIYSSGTTRLYDPGNEIIRAEGLRFSTIYPGGIFGDCTFWVPRDVRSWMEAVGAKRLVIRNGMLIVWEGLIDNLVSSLQESSSEVEIKGIGQWGTILGRRRWNKPWCEMRIDETIWIPQTGAQYDKFNCDRNERMMVTPKDGVTFNSSDYIDFAKYFAPTGETVKRITFSYDLQEGAQAWTLGLWNDTGGSGDWSVTSSGSGSEDHTFATPAAALHFYFQAAAGQTGIGDGTIYGKITNLKLYTEIGSINLTEVAKDIIGKITSLNSTEVYVGSNTFTLEPFISEGYQEISGILKKALEKGDSSYYKWAAYLDHSEKAPSPDGKPVLVVEQEPALTDYDYEMRLEEIDPDFSFDRYYDELWNWIIVRYTDAKGKETWITPDDDATLKNQTSIDDYGQRDYELVLEQESSTTATNAGKTFLLDHKDPKYRMSGAIRVKGTIRTKQGILLPACQIRAGKRLKIGNFMQDLSGSGLTFVIGQTDYSAEDEICEITAGSDLMGEMKLIKGKI